jgi:23S rRNA pseudouridine1911/1915/1917 synthase
MARVLHTTEADDGMRLDQFLAAAVSGVSRTQLQRIIDEGGVSVDGATAKKRHSLRAGQEVVLDESALAPRAGTPAAPEDIPIDVLFEDEHLIVVNKPAGLVVHPGSGNRSGTLVNALLFHVEDLSDGFEDDRPGIVHRLDKDTSGVLLVVKTNTAHAALAQQFQDRTVEKEYLGMCVGRRPPEQGVVEQPLGRSRTDPTRICIRPNGRPATTEYQLLAHRGGVSVMRFVPRTGRTHQIRVHAAHLGTPVLADAVYGGDREAVMRLQPLERPFAHKVLKCFTRHALHAHRIAFTHPVSGKRMRMTAPLPPDMQAAIALFGDEVKLR